MSYCQCISLEDAVLAKGFYLVAHGAPPLALSVNILDLYMATATASAAGVATLDDVLKVYFRIKGINLASIIQHQYS